jgi:hypothetical protein
MFERSQIERAVDLQQRSYKLLRWMIDAIDRGFISIGAAHTFSTFPEATTAWIDRHYNDLPNAARPPRDDMPTSSTIRASASTRPTRIVSVRCAAGSSTRRACAPRSSSGPTRSAPVA